LFEDLEIFACGKRQLDRAIDLEIEAELFAIEHGHAALDDAFFFEALDAAPTRAGGKTNPLGDFGDREGGVVLDQIEDAGIHGVEPVGQDYFPATVVLVPFVPNWSAFAERLGQALSVDPYIIATSGASRGGKVLAMGRAIAAWNEISVPWSGSPVR
jgi:hypothetical protein